MDRLDTLVEMVQEGLVVADIGTDHAQLPIRLIDQGKCSKVYACDVRKGPLQQAQHAIEKAGMGKMIFPILCDGLDEVPMDTTGIVLAGMGMKTAVGILERGIDRLSALKQILLEVQTDEEEMRKWISDHHYTIEEETCIEDRGKYYIAMSVSPKHHSSYLAQELLCGPKLQKKPDPIYQAYVLKQIEKIQTILEKRNRQDKQQEILEKQMSNWKQALKTNQK